LVLAWISGKIAITSGEFGKVQPRELPQRFCLRKNVNIHRILICLPTLLLTCTQVSAQEKSVPGKDAQKKALTFKDISGVEHRPLADPKAKAAVLIFVLPDCPVANSYAPEIKRLCDEYAKRGIRFYLVHVDPDLSVADAAKHAKEYGHTCPIVLDGKHQLVRRAGATRVPECAVFSPDGERKYLGRIDDVYASPGQRRNQPSSRDLRITLDALLAGQPVPRPITEVVGCYIPTLPE
jgi:thiol-disulfide isomerase/thioredoxin